MINATYNRNNRRQSSGYTPLPKDAYVVRILSAKVVTTEKGTVQLVMAFDIAEGPYKGHYMAAFERSRNEDKRWPADGTFRLTIPYPGCPDWVQINWDSALADIEDSNPGYVWNGDERTLKGKLVGAKMRIEEWRSKTTGDILESTKLYWTCVADDVRQGRAGTLPKDKRIEKKEAGAGNGNGNAALDEFLAVGGEDEIPFD